MPIMQNIVLTDSAAATHTFKPQMITEKQVAVYRESAENLFARNELTIQQREVRERGVNRPSTKVSLPIVATVTDPVSGVPVSKIVRTLTASTDFSVPHASTDAEREMLISLLIASLQHADVHAVIVDGEMVIGG